MRIAKRIAHAGIASRREGEKLIFEGKVFVNGVVVKDPSVKVEDDDKVEVRNSNATTIGNRKALTQALALPPSKKPLKVFLVHKLAYESCKKLPERDGMIDSSASKKKETISSANISDSNSREIVKKVAGKSEKPKEIPNLLERIYEESSDIRATGRLVFVAGGLDLQTEGLVVLCNNPTFARYLEMPESKITKEFNAFVSHAKPIEELKLGWLKSAPRIQGHRFPPIDAKYAPTPESSNKINDCKGWLSLSVSEGGGGGTRDIRQVLEFGLGVGIRKLIRTRFGPFFLGDIPRGGIVSVDCRKLHLPILKVDERGNVYCTEKDIQVKEEKLQTLG